MSSTVTVTVSQCHTASAMTRMWPGCWYHCAPWPIPSRACLSTANLLRNSPVILYLTQQTTLTDYTLHLPTLILQGLLIVQLVLDVLYFLLIICAPRPFANQLTVNRAPV